MLLKKASKPILRQHRKPKAKHSSEYTKYIQGQEWKKTSNFVIWLTGGYCVLHPWKKASHTHHMTYKNMKHELPIRDCVPLSKNAHAFIHQDRFWNLNNDSQTPSPLKVWVNWGLRIMMLLAMLILPLRLCVRLILWFWNRGYKSRGF